MKPLIKYSIFSLIIGIIISTLGMTGNFSVQADTLKASYPVILDGSNLAVIAGAVLILIALVLFLTAVGKSNK